MGSNDTKIGRKLLPIMLTFFVMGFVDLVGTATNYVKADFALSDTLANLLPSMVFFWFLIFAVPTGLLMNRIGRRNTVLLSLIVTVVALFIPLISYSFAIMMICFALIGIGNALMQVSLNPLISNIVSGDKMASNLTLGQFVKAIASFIAPILAGWLAVKFGNWRLLFPIFMVISLIATIWLWATNIEETAPATNGSSLSKSLSLLGDKVILLCFLGIMCHVGIDVGTNVTAPKLMIERAGLPLTEAALATSVYFLFRTLGCFSGTFILSKCSPRKFFLISTLLMILGMGGLFFASTKWAIWICVALMGYGNSNIFPIIFAKGMQYMPDKQNEISGLMIMGLFGGTIFPFLMGILSDVMGGLQIGAVIVMFVCILYLFFAKAKITNQQ